MNWDEILALPSKNIPSKEIVEFRKKVARRRNK
jgi:hypothetical protein